MVIQTTRSIYVIIGVIGLVASWLPLPFIEAQQNNGSPDIFPPDAKPYGVNYGEWTAKWWQWTSLIPLQKNPATDTTGGNCAEGQNGPVWFLAGTFGGKAERICTVPTGKAILVPIINSECSYLENPDLKTESELRNCVKVLQDETTHVEATIDGMNIPPAELYRVQSPLLNVTFPKDNTAGIPAGTTQGVSDGNWLFLKSLATGKHDLHFNGVSVDFTSTGSNTFAVDVTYHLIVK